MIQQLCWRLIAFIVSRQRVAWWLKTRAERTPYNHIRGQDGSLYMGRWWLFNPYPRDEAERERRKQKPTIWDRLPSVRIHHIMRADSDRHLHDHPWNARTIILRGWYIEEKPGKYFAPRGFHDRKQGYTGRLLFGEFHRIDQISDGGVWTMFITWRYQGTWGFSVDGVKVPWRKYLGLEKPVHVDHHPV